MRTPLVRSCALLTALGLAACGGSEPVTPDPTPDGGTTIPDAGPADSGPPSAREQDWTPTLSATVAIAGGGRLARAGGGLLIGWSESDRGFVYDPETDTRVDFEDAGDADLVELSPSGTHAALFDFGGRTRIVELATGRTVGQLEGLAFATWTADGAHLVGIADVTGEHIRQGTAVAASAPDFEVIRLADRVSVEFTATRDGVLFLQDPFQDPDVFGASGRLIYASADGATHHVLSERATSSRLWPSEDRRRVLVDRLTLFDVASGRRLYEAQAPVERVDPNLDALAHGGPDGVTVWRAGAGARTIARTHQTGIVGLGADSVAWIEVGDDGRQLLLDVGGQTTELARGANLHSVHMSDDLERLLYFDTHPTLHAAGETEVFAGFTVATPLDPYLDAIFFDRSDGEPVAVLDVATGSFERLENDADYRVRMATDAQALLHTIRTARGGVPHLDVFERGVRRARFEGPAVSVVEGGFAQVLAGDTLELVAAGQAGPVEIARGVEQAMLAGDWSFFRTADGLFARRLR